MCDAPVQEETQLPELEKTTAAQCLDIMLREYEIERGKRQSFENRAGIVMAVLAALALFVFEKVPLSALCSMAAQSPWPYGKIFSCLLLYASFFFSLGYTINSLRTRTYDNFLVENVDEYMIGQKPLAGSIILIKEYREIIAQHREENQKVAYSLMNAMVFLCISLVSIALYINL